jgi:hypothetical protein
MPPPPGGQSSEIGRQQELEAACIQRASDANSSSGITTRQAGCRSIQTPSEIYN